MSDGSDIAAGLAEVHDVLRNFFVGENVSLKLLKGDGSTLATLTSGWNLGHKEYTDIESGARYYKLYVDDLDGSRLAHLKAMATVRVKGFNFKFIGKDSSLAIQGTIPSYEFKVQAIGEQLA
jgi:hypothetical protein